MLPHTPSARPARARASLHRLPLAAGVFLFAPALLAQTTTLHFNGYPAGASAVGVNDPQLSGAAAWQAKQSGSASRWTATSVAANGSGLGLRLLDDQVGTDGSYAYHLDLAGATGTAEQAAANTKVFLGQTFTISFDLRLTGSNATTGTDQAWIQFGREDGPAPGPTKNWLFLGAHQSRLRLFVDGVGGARVPVDIGPVPTAFTRISITVDPQTKRYENVLYGGMDVTSIMRAQHGGTIPWRISPTDTTASPDARFWVTSGEDDRVVVDLDNLRISNSAEPWVSTAAMPTALGGRREWLPYLTGSTDTRVLAGSALDLGPLLGLNRELHGDALITGRGFAVVNQAGDLSFANDPDNPHVRLFCAAEVMLHFPVPDGLSGAQLDAALDTYVDRLVRSGYNAYRPHFLDVYLMQGSTADTAFNPARLLYWQKLASKLRKKAIYLSMDASTSWNSFLKEPFPNTPYDPATDGDPYYTPEAKLRRVNVRMLFDGDAREHWKAGVTRLYTTPNPFVPGGLALKDDPQVIFSNLRNESGITFRLGSDKLVPELKSDPALLSAWRGWLFLRYGPISAIRDAWQVSAAAYPTIASIPVPVLDEHATGYHAAMYTDFRRFEVDTGQSLFLWMQQTMREIGVKSLLVDHNIHIDRPSALIRDAMPTVDNHIYHDHGTGDTANGLAWKHDNSSVSDDAIGIARFIGQSRLIGTPLTVTEWGQPFWSRFRHEAGLAFPSYASLQGWSMIAQHASPVGRISAVSGNPLVHQAKVFQVANDPTALASETMSGLLYGRGDVRRSPNLVAIDIVNPTEADPLIDRWGYKFPFKIMPLLARFGLRVHWPKVLHDDFGDASLQTATSIAPGTGWSAQTFWIGSGSGASERDVASGRLRLTARNGAWAHSLVRSPSPTDGKTPLDLFSHPRQFHVKGLQFESDPSNGVSTAHRVFRLAIASGPEFAQAAQHSVILEVFGHNRVRVGYKVNSASIGEAYHYVEDFTLPAPARGFSFTPLAVDMNEFVGDEHDYAYDLIIHLDGSAGAPAYRHVTGRWNKNSPSENKRLNPANWSGHAANTVQLQAQKYDGSDNGKFVRVLCDEFTIHPRQRGPRNLDLPVARSWPSTPEVNFDTVLAHLRTEGVLSSDNTTQAPSLANPNVMLAPEIYQSGRYQSDTKELFHDPVARRLTVATDRSEGATLPAVLKNGSAAAPAVDLPNVKITNLPAPDLPNSATVLVSSLEPATAAANRVNDSGKLLLVVSADSINTGQNFQDYRRLAQLSTGLVNSGEGAPPVLLRRTKLEVRIRNIHAATLKVYPLQPNGQRRAAIPTTTANEGGHSWLVIPIDTGDLDGNPATDDAPAIYFEIAP